MTKITMLEVAQIHNANPEFSIAQVEFEALQAAYAPYAFIPFDCSLFGAYTDAVELVEA